MNAEFKKGDVVRLKSGGPKMTAESIDSIGRVWVSYFDEKKVFHKQVIASEALELVNKVTPGPGRLVQSKSSNSY